MKLHNFNSLLLACLFFPVFASVQGCLWISGKIERIEFSSGLSTTSRALSLAPTNPVIDINGSMTFSAAGGASSYVFSIVGAALGSTINSSTGVFSASNTTGTVTIKVTDSAGSTSTTTVTIYNPLSASVLMWLKADALALADGASVPSWTDSSGNLNHMVQAGPANQPTYRTNIVNNKPVVRFDGTNDYLANTLTPATSNNPRAFAFVIANNSQVVTPQILMNYGDSAFYRRVYGIAVPGHSKNTGGGPDNMYGRGLGISSYFYSDATTSPSYLFTKKTPPTSPTIIIQDYDSTNESIWINGSLAATKVLALNTVSSIPLTIGRDVATSSDYWGGDLVETLVYNSNLVTANRQTLECYLGQKYNVTLSNSICGSGSLTLHPSPAPMISINQTTTFSAYGGSSPYTYSVTGGGSINSTTGVFTAGTSASTSTVTATDNAGNTTSVNISVSSYPAPKLWLKADAITGVANGATVSVWPDSSSNENSAASTRALDRPTYQTGVLNGLPVVRFAGAQALRTHAFIASGANPRTIAVVITNLNTGVANQVILSQGPSIAGNDAIGFTASTSASGLLGMYYNSGLDWDSTAPTTASPSLLLVRYNGTTDEFFFNGAAAGSSAGSGSVSGINDAVVLGGASNAGGMLPGRYFQGDIAEVMGWDSLLSDTDRTTVENYLKTKYNIP